MALWNEWQSYELIDFLMFSPSVYFRMVAGYVGVWWPLAFLILLAFAGAIYVWGRSGGDWPVWGLLVAAWVVPVPLFFLARYAEIMSAAPGYAALFTLQGTLLLIAWAHPVKAPAVVSPLNAQVGLGLMAIALLGFPLVAGLAGRGWAVFEPVFLMPDAAVPLTLGWFLFTGERRLLLWGVPALWTVISALTLHTMGQPDFWLLPSLTMLAVIAAFFSRRGASARK